MSVSFRKLVESNARGLTSFDLYLKLMVCPPSMFMAWILLNFTKVSANQLTAFGLFAGCLGSVCSLFFGLSSLVAGFYIAMICDFADGSLARNGRGSGMFGIFFDVVADRAVLCVASLCLLAHHLQTRSWVESLVLMMYTLAYLYGDILCYGLHIAKTRSGEVLAGPTAQGSLSVQDVFFKPVYFIPSRLSSPLFILIIKALLDSFFWGYCAGLLAVLAEYLREGLRVRSLSLRS